MNMLIELLKLRNLKTAAIYLPSVISTYLFVFTVTVYTGRLSLIRHYCVKGQFKVHKVTLFFKSKMYFLLKKALIK